MDVDISVDLLYPAEKTTFENLDPKNYGVIVSSGYKKGLLLPNLEGVDTAKQQVEIAMNKGGITNLESYESSLWYEYVLETAKKIKELNKGHKVVIVSNGYISEEPLRELLPYVDALNIDLKGNNEYYKKLCFGSLEEVKRTIKIASEMGKHIEVTTLLIPKENTDNKTLEDIGEFLNEVDKKIPLHVSRYFPMYKMESQSTSLDEMKNAYNMLKGYLDNVYLGNLNKEELKYCIEK